MLTMPIFKARKEAARHEIARRKETEQANSTTDSQMRGKAESDQAPALISNEGSVPDQNLITPQAVKPCGGKYINTDLTPKTTLPMYDRQNNEDETWQQYYSCGYVATPRVSYDDSDPDRGFTEDAAEPLVAQEEYHGHGDYDLHNDHRSHMEVHRGFWDIVDSEDECDFCRNICTVMQCPSCDVQACAYCKDTYG